MANGQFTLGMSITSVAAAALVAVGSMMWSHVETVAKNSEIALDVAGQHGQELLAIRQQIEKHSMALAELRAQVSLGERFTRQDGDRMQKRLDRLSETLEEVKERGGGDNNPVRNP